MKSILLIGAGHLGSQLAVELNKLGHEIMAIDSSEEKINAILPIVTDAQIGDCTNVDFLESIGARNFDVCFVTIGKDFQSSLETTFNLKELGAEYVISRAETEAQAKFLLRNGADDVIYPEKQIAQWAAMRYSSNHVLDYIQIDDTYSIFEVSVPEPWLGKSIKDIDIRRKYNVNIVTIRQNGEMKMAIDPDMILTEDITLFVVGEYKVLQKRFHI